MEGKVFLGIMLFEQYLGIGRDLCQADKTNKGFWAEGTVGANAPRQTPKGVGYLVDGSPFWNVGYMMVNQRQIMRLKGGMRPVEEGLRSHSNGLAFWKLW